MTLQALITWLIKSRSRDCACTDDVAVRALITCLSGSVATEQGPQEAILKERSRHEPRNQQAISMELISDESCRSTGNNQARDQAGITQLSWQLSSR